MERKAGQKFIEAEKAILAKDHDDRLMRMLLSTKPQFKDYAKGVHNICSYEVILICDYIYIYGLTHE